jgi:NitT/TauT family transport system ATP-binding protein
VRPGDLRLQSHGLFYLCNVSKVFEREILAISRLEIMTNEILGVIGPSGCGKTTLLRILAGLDLATAGTLLFLGKPLAGAGSDRILVTQESSLFPWNNVLQNVRMALKPLKLGSRQTTERALAALAAIGLESAKNKRPYELSGGMMQKVAFVRAMARGTSCLLLDEPFSAIDELSRQELREWLRSEVKRRQITVVFVTHSIDEAVFMSDRIVILSSSPGTIVAEVPVEMNKSRDVRWLKTDQFEHLVQKIQRVLRMSVLPDAGRSRQPRSPLR